MQRTIIRLDRKRRHTLKVSCEYIKGNKRYKIAGYYVAGKRVRKYFGTKAAADAFVQEEEIRRSNLGHRATRIDGALAEDAIRAADALEGTPYTVLDAARVVAKAHAVLVPYSITISDAVAGYAARVAEQRRSVCVANLITEFIGSRRAKGRRPSYLQDLATRLGRFEAAWGTEVVSNVTTQDIDLWIHSLNVGPQTQNNFRSVLSAMWTFAVRRGYAVGNIVQLVDKANVTRDHVPIFTVDQIASLLQVARWDYLPVLAIGAFAGLRPEEINKLRWEDIDFEDRTIRVNATASKTRKKRFAEIPNNLMAWLQPHSGRTGSVRPRNLQKLRLATMKGAGINHWPQDVLRHSFASAHYAFHKNPAHTAMLLGHRDQNMLLTHYRDLMKPAEAERYWAVFPNVKRAGKIISIGSR